uniref:Uncharacterized protein n=1 Tax=Anopheles atroparvus TaxID=41427 RepID=A0A182JG71_ANOAO
MSIYQRIDDLEQFRFAVAPKHAARDLAQELLQHACDRVDRVVVHVHQPALLEEVYELLHRALVARRPEHVLPDRSFLVELQDQYQQRPRDVVLAHLLQRHAELDLLQPVRRGGGFVDGDDDITALARPGLSYREKAEQLEEEDGNGCYLWARRCRSCHIAYLRLADWSS